MILKAILLDRTMEALYEKMQSDQFEALIPDQQIATVEGWITSTERLAPKATVMVAGARRLLPGLTDAPNLRDDVGATWLCDGG